MPENYLWNNIGYIGSKYLGLALSKLILLTNLSLWLIYLNCFIINDKYFLVLFWSDNLIELVFVL